jgi:hypothetical protein
VSAVLKELGMAPPPVTKADKEQVPVIKYKGVEYFLNPKKGSGNLVFELFSKTDDTFKRPLGEIGINPGTGTFKGSVPKIF